MVYIRSFIFNSVFYVGTAILVVLMGPLLLLPPFLARYVARFWGWLAHKQLYIVGIHQREYGDKHLDKQVIYAVKHQSAWETFFLYTLFENPIYFLKKELNKIPILSFYFKKLGFIYVDRKTTFKTSKIILTKIKNHEIDNKRTIIIFPEGTRTRPGEKNNLGAGVFLLYKHLNLPIITIRHNSGSFWINQKIKKKIGTIKLEIFPPIQPGKKKKKL